MTTPDDDDRPLPGTGSMDANGRFERLEPEPPASGAPPVRKRDEAPLELGDRPAPRRYEEPEPYREERPQRRARGPALALALGVFALMIAGGWWALRPSNAPRDGVRALTPLEEQLLGPSAHTVVVESVPAGATLRIDGKEIGTTPWAGDSRWSGEVKVELEKPGYRTWQGTLEGGQETEIKATLKRK